MTGITGSAPQEPAAVAETHVSVVFFIGNLVYKLKKPVDLGFLDFRTREARETVCRREVELNRRLAPDVYLGMVDLVGPGGAPLDHLVVMRRMPGDARLSALVTAGRNVDAELDSIAQVLAAFHAGAETSPEIAEAGRVDHLRGLWEANNEQLRTLGPSTPAHQGPFDPTVVAEVAMLAERYLAGRGALFDERIVEGRIRDGHGDVLADDIFCLPDGPRILDCIEFDDRLRYGDVLGDVAFLAMDLERLGRPELGAALVRRYREITAETYPETLVDFWIAYRAQVRAKVAALRAGQGAYSAAGEAGRLLAMALSHLRRCQVKLVLIGGSPGTGKSTIGKAVARERGWELIRSDVVRKELFGPSGSPPPESSSPEVRSDIGKGIYDSASTRATYDEMLNRAGHHLARGVSVVLDASWTDARFRSHAATLAARTHSDLVELLCEAPMDIALARIDERAERGKDPSDATAAVAKVLRDRAAPWPSATVIDTGGALDDSIAQVWAALDT